jgi:hypothetical protein
METFTFLDRNANRDVALTWRESIYKPGTVKILPSDDFAAVVGILSSRGSVQTVGRRRDELRDHEARANSACIHVRSPFRCSRVQVKTGRLFGRSGAAGHVCQEHFDRAALMRLLRSAASAWARR